MSFIKFFLLLTLIVASATGMGQEKNASLTLAGEEKEGVIGEAYSRFQPRIGFERMDLKEYKSGSQSSELKRDSMNGLNVGLAYTIPLGDRFTTYTIPNISYVQIGGQSSGNWGYDMKNVTYKLNQTIAVNIFAGNTIIQPYFGVGFGYGTQEYNYSFNGGSSFKNEVTYEGTLLETNIGVQLLVSNWVPFIQYTSRTHKVSKFSDIPSWKAGTFRDPENEAYSNVALTIGAGYRF